MQPIPFDEIRGWLAEALPYWAEHGVDAEHGGFLEEVSFSGAPTACAFKRVRVQCRQIYVFAHAAVLGWAPGAALSRRGQEFLLAKARRDDGSFARRLSRTGAIIDATPDLYDLAFVLFAMAWRYRVEADEEALACAHAVLGFIDGRMRHPEAGYWSALPPAPPLTQNPHMHLAEACLAAFEATQDQLFLDRARELVALFRSRLFNGVSLGERFDAGWGRLGGAAGALEPGHHFEWAWILGQHRRLAGDDLSREAAALVAFAERCGVDPASQAVCDLVDAHGAPAASSSRAWTNAERIKAHLALYEMLGADPRAPAAASARLLLDRYFAGLPRGLWVDCFDIEGAPMAEAVPASIVYHLLLAFSEALRLEPQLRPQTP